MRPCGTRAVAPPVGVRLPEALLRLFPEASPRVEVEAKSVAEVVDALDRRWPGMRDRLCDSRPSIRRNINVFVGGVRAALDTPLAPGAEVVVMTAVMG